jgi:hypothetical protein
MMRRYRNPSITTDFPTNYWKDGSPFLCDLLIHGRSGFTILVEIGGNTWNVN